eukprot:14714836-Heterocapsa_arctica.AAC.1
MPGCAAFYRRVPNQPDQPLRQVGLGTPRWFLPPLLPTHPRRPRCSHAFTVVARCHRPGQTTK